MSELNKMYELLEVIKKENNDKVNKQASIDTIENIKILLNDLNTIIVWNNNNKKLNW